MKKEKLEYLIIKVCCFDCYKYEGLYYSGKDYLDTIRKIEDYEDYDYIIYEIVSFYEIGRVKGWAI